MMFMLFGHNITASVEKIWLLFTFQFIYLPPDSSISQYNHKMSVVKQAIFFWPLQQFRVSLFFIVNCVFFVVMVQSIEEECLRGIIRDILGLSGDSDLTVRTLCAMTG
jgi:hypothetical protein